MGAFSDYGINRQYWLPYVRVYLPSFEKSSRSANGASMSTMLYFAYMVSGNRTYKEMAKKIVDSVFEYLFDLSLIHI